MRRLHTTSRPERSVKSHNSKWRCLLLSSIPKRGGEVHIFVCVWGGEWGWRRGDRSIKQTNKTELTQLHTFTRQPSMGRSTGKHVGVLGSRVSRDLLLCHSSPSDRSDAHLHSRPHRPSQQSQRSHCESAMPQFIRSPFLGLSARSSGVSSSSLWRLCRVLWMICDSLHTQSHIISATISLQSTSRLQMRSCLHQNGDITFLSRSPRDRDLLAAQRAMRIVPKCIYIHPSSFL